VLVQIKIAGRSVTLESVSSDSGGKVALPAVTLTKLGRYPVAIVNPATGRTSYVKLILNRAVPRS